MAILPFSCSLQLVVLLSLIPWGNSFRPPLPLCRPRYQIPRTTTTTTSTRLSTVVTTAASADRPQTSTSAEKKIHKQKLLDSFLQDCERLSQIRPASALQDPSIPEALISLHGSSYTRLWTKDTWRAHSKPPHLRYARHTVKIIYSSTARKILPVVALATLWSGAAAIIVQKWNTIGILATPAVSYLTAPMALLLTLRTNASMGRLNEARIAWGRLVLHARSFASVVKCHLGNDADERAIQMMRHLVICGWLLKAQLRAGEDMEVAQEEVCSIMLSPTDKKWLIAQAKPTVALTARMRFLASRAMAQSSTASRLIVEHGLAQLEGVVGITERLFRSPIPPTYSRHLSRIIVMWLSLLPISCVKAGLSVLACMVVTAIASYTFIGIDEVGMELENPFQLLPLQQLAAAVQSESMDQYATTMPEDE